MEPAGIVIIVLSALLLISVVVSTITRKSKSKAATDTVEGKEEKKI